MLKLLTKIFGSRNERQIKRMRRSVQKINALEPDIAQLSDEQLKAKTAEFRARFQNGETLEQLLPEAFAVVREAGKRTLNMRHFDVQLVGGMTLHEGKIAEMRTGEGKTLVATLAAYLNAIPGKGVHIVTVNDYLARRDADWMGTIYRFLGLSVGVIVSQLDPGQRREAYAADITYGTNNEFGFDYLRDNMAFTAEERVQRSLNYAIVDEVDSILIDEARTPLIISGPTDDSSDLYRQVNELIPRLKKQSHLPEKDEPEPPGDYGVDEKNKQVYLSEEGHQHIEDMLIEVGLLKPDESLYDPKNIMLMHHVQAALRAHALFERNVDYIVRDEQVIIVDEFTGRTMPGRRWSEGLHQAVEAKEGVDVKNENQTLASITFQNYFRLYQKLAGMTGTADTEAFEFQQIYHLEVLVIPTHKPMIRDDRGDLIYLTEKEKYKAILEDIKDCRQRGQPVLVGTVSIENSEKLARMLTEEDIPHQVLNAKFHEQEAHIITQAGRPGTVTIATNMAGRGTDIVLGGNLEAELSALENPSQDAIEKTHAEWKARHEQVVQAGGLHVIGTERHESRRVDNQLRGRSGRQGDPGSSRFYLSLEDPLMRIFASERVSGIMQKLGMEEGESIEHPWVSKAIESAQRKVEGRNFDIRKQLLEFDDVANDQRKEVYRWRSELMEINDVSETVTHYRHQVLNALIDQYIPPGTPDEMWDVAGLEKALEQEFITVLPLQQWLDEDHELHEETLREKIEQHLSNIYQRQSEQVAAGLSAVREYEKGMLLQVLDRHWKEHLAAMDYLRQGIHLRGYAQKNPKQEYKREAFEMFSVMLDQIKFEVVRTLTTELHRVAEQAELDLAALQEQARRNANLQYHHAEASALAQAEEEEARSGSIQLSEKHAAATAAAYAAGHRLAQHHHEPYVREERKVGRNEPCPCGSGKKYKHCHGKLA